MRALPLDGRHHSQHEFHDLSSKRAKLFPATGTEFLNFALLAIQIRLARDPVNRQPFNRRRGSPGHISGSVRSPASIEQSKVRADRRADALDQGGHNDF